jgi:hypothetical protein
VKPTPGWTVAIALTIWGAFAAAPVTRSDVEIARTFREKLSKSKLKSEGIQIKVEKGIATITGRTEVLQHKGTATRMAKSSGATQVHNDMIVGEAARKAAGERLAAARNKAFTKSRPVVQNPPPASKAAAPTHVPPPVRRATIQP